jgi:tetratricopeptide (TPR) repeat protein
MAARHPEEERLKAAHAEQCWRFGLDLRVAGQFERAQEMFDRAESYYSSPSIPIDPYVYLQRVLAFKAAAQLARQRGELERSEDLLDRMNRACDSMLARWPDSFDAAVQRIESDNERAHIRHAQGRPEEQLALQRATVAAKRALRARHPEQQQTGMSLAMSCINCADVLCRQGSSLEEAQALYAEADQLLEAAHFRPGDLFPSNLRGEAWLGLGSVARRNGRVEEAREILRRAETNQLQVLQIHPPRQRSPVAALLHLPRARARRAALRRSRSLLSLARRDRPHAGHAPRARRHGFLLGRADRRARSSRRRATYGSRTLIPSQRSFSSRTQMRAKPRATRPRIADSVAPFARAISA